MNISYDVVDIVLIYKKFGKSRVGKSFYQCAFRCFVDIYGDDFRTRNHAFPGTSS